MPAKRREPPSPSPSRTPPMRPRSGVSTGPTSSMMSRRTPTFARPGNGSPTTTRMSMTARRCTTIGRTSARPARSNTDAPQAKSAVFVAGSTRIFLSASRSVLTMPPDKIPLRSRTVEHPFGTIKAWMGATHFKMKTPKHVATEMALHLLAYNLMRVIAILGVPGLIKAMRASAGDLSSHRKPRAHRP